MSEKGKFLMERFGISHEMSAWIADKMPDLENRIEEYFRYRLDGEPEITFAGWLAGKNIRLPRPCADCPDMPDAKVMGVPWSVLQSLLFRAEDSKSFYRMLDGIVAEKDAQSGPTTDMEDGNGPR